MKRSRVVWIVLLLVAVAAGAYVAANRAWLGSVAAESVLSSLMGGAHVRVTEVAIVEGRQLKLKGVVIDGGLVIDEAVITYDLADFLARRVDPLASVIRADLYGLRGSEAQFVALTESISSGMSQPQGHKAPIPSADTGAGSGAIAATEGRSASVSGRGWTAPVGLVDCVITTQAAGSLTIPRAEFRPDCTQLHVEFTNVGLDAEFADVELTGTADVVLSAVFDTDAVSRAVLSFRSKARDGMELSGAVSLDAAGVDRLRATVNSSHGNAEVEFVGELEAALPAGRPEARAAGDVTMAVLNWDSVAMRDWTFGADIAYGNGVGKVVLDGAPTGVDRIVAALGPSQAWGELAAWAPMLRGWVDWGLELTADSEGAEATLRFTDGEVAADLVDGLDTQFTAVRGALELAYSADDGRTSLGRVAMDAQSSGGSVHAEGQGDDWRLVAHGVGLVHQIVNAKLDADVRYTAGSIAGRMALAEGAIDAVTAGFSSMPNIPDLGVDVTIEIGQGLRVERERSWAHVEPGSEIRVSGNLRDPAFSGRIDLGSGELEVSGQTFAVVGGQAVLEPGAEPEFALTLAEHVDGKDVLLTARGELGDVRLQLASAAAPDDGEIPHGGDTLVKLIGSRVRQYILDQVAVWLDSIPPTVAGTYQQKAN